MAKKLRYYIESVLALLRVKVFVGGLEISDLVLRFAYFDGKEWRLSGVRLEPGVMTAGKVNDPPKFLAALQALKAQVTGPLASKKKINVIVSLSSVNIYTHSFNLPIVEKENLQEAIALNVQMVSPVDISLVYPGWQIIGEDRSSNRVEILSSFLDRALADDIRATLLTAGFICVAIEPKSLSLTRLLMEEAAGFDSGRPYVMVHIDSAGVTFLIVSKGHLYFEYFNPWRDIMDDKGQIPIPAFEATMTRSLRQVTNFYSQHWTDPLTEVILSASALVEQAEKAITSNFSFAVKELKSHSAQPMSPEWFVALGSGLRGLKSRRKDREMSLSGIGANDEFHREQLVNFLGFWRVLIPIVLAILVMAFFGASLFLSGTRKTLETQATFDAGGDQTKQSIALTAEAADFNTTVGMVQNIQSANFPRSAMWESIYAMMAQNNITISHFIFQSASAPITLSASAPTVDQISAFKKALLANPKISEIALPITSIQPTGGGYTFTMTFKYIP